MISEVELKKLYWHSRRGMLELDLLLIPFVQKRLSALSDEEQQLYEQLLEEEDQDLFVWLIGKEPASGSGLQRIIDVILER
jgi:antitoxin CptB